MAAMTSFHAECCHLVNENDESIPRPGAYAAAYASSWSVSSTFVLVLIRHSGRILIYRSILPFPLGHAHQTSLACACLRVPLAVVSQSVGNYYWLNVQTETRADKLALRLYYTLQMLAIQFCMALNLINASVLHCVSKKRALFLFLRLFCVLLTDLKNVSQYCSKGNLQQNAHFKFYIYIYILYFFYI